MKRAKKVKVFKGFHFSYSILEVRKTVETQDSKALR